MPRLLWLAALLSAAPAAVAQPFVTPAHEAPVAITDLARVATGGAVVALPTLDSPFLSNPAHVTDRGLTVTVLGAAAGVGGNVNETWAYYRDELGPAIEEGLDSIRTANPGRLERLYDEAFRIGGQPKTADLAVLGPSVRFATGPAAVGVGAYAQAVTRGRITDRGGGIPFIDLYSRADLAVPVVAGVDLSKTPAGLTIPFGLRLGASATYVQRRVTAKASPVDALDPDAEKLYVLRADGVRLAVGAYATDVGVPGLDVGASVSNVGGSFDYDFDRSIVIEGSEEDPDDAVEIATLEARFDDRPAEAVVRLGAAYRLPSVPGLADAAVGVDYSSARTSDFDQSTQAGLRGGVRARLAGVLAVRAGLSQGMPSAGIGIVTRAFRLEYATYGVEDGRLLGQLRRRNHVVQLRFGLL